MRRFFGVEFAMFRNDRQYHRCPISDDQPPAVLQIDRRKVNCRLTEVSLGGFAVLAPSQLEDIRDPVGQLDVQGLAYIVRVTRQETRRDGVMVALEKVEEILPSTVSVAGRFATGFAWIAAISIVMAAVYYLAGDQATMALSKLL